MKYITSSVKVESVLMDGYYLLVGERHINSFCKAPAGKHKTELEMRWEIIQRVSERIICKHTGNYNET